MKPNLAMLFKSFQGFPRTLGGLIMFNDVQCRESDGYHGPIYMFGSIWQFGHPISPLASHQNNKVLGWICAPSGLRTPDILPNSWIVGYIPLWSMIKIPWKYLKSYPLYIFITFDLHSCYSLTIPVGVFPVANPWPTRGRCTTAQQPKRVETPKAPAWSMAWKKRLGS